MNKKLVCTECGATIIFEQGKEKDTCNFCGSLLDLSAATEIALERDVEAAARDAQSFKNALIAEVNGSKASITDMWDSLTSNPKLPKDKLFNFYKVLKSKIRFCIDAYQNMSDDVKYELGDFICAQMQSMINFRIRNQIGFIEEMDEIQNLIRKQRYDFKARGLFQIKAKIIIWKRIKRIKARETVLYYDYALQSIQSITASYNSQIEPIKDELNATALTAFARRKTLKEKISSLELDMKRQIDEFNMKKATKEYNRVVRKFKIEHSPLTEEIKEYTPIQKSAEKKAMEPSIDYSSMPLLDLIDALTLSLSKLNTAITRTETETCKTIKAALEARASSLSGEAQMYFNAIMMSVNMVFSNEHPAVMSAMLKNVFGNISTQSTNLKNVLSTT